VVRVESAEAESKPVDMIGPQAELVYLKLGEEPRSLISHDIGF
jgi:hypothetical protein